MERDEALQLLGLPANATEEQVRKAYGEVYNDYQLRLTNAPTPNLKKLYQKNLEETNQALSVLLGQGASGVLKDLPSSSPTFSAEVEPLVARPATRTEAGRTAAPAKPGPEKGKTSMAPMLMLLAGIVGLAGAVFFAMRASAAQEKLAEAEPYKAQVEQLQQDLETFKQGRMKIQNVGEVPFTVTGIIYTYVDPEGRLKKDWHELDVTVRGGGSEPLEVITGGTATWDGTVLSYTMTVMKSGWDCPWIEAGMWAQQQQDGYIRLNFDDQ